MAVSTENRQMLEVELFQEDGDGPVPCGRCGENIHERDETVYRMLDPDSRLCDTIHAHCAVEDGHRIWWPGETVPVSPPGAP